MTRSAPPEPFKHSNKRVCLTPTGEGAPRRGGGIERIKRSFRLRVLAVPHCTKKNGLVSATKTGSYNKLINDTSKFLLTDTLLWVIFGTQLDTLKFC